MDVLKRLPTRQLGRLRGFDYTASGAYFVTICTQNRACILGDAILRDITLTETGLTVDRCWRDIPTHFPGIRLDTHVVMPNHIHGIVILHEQHTCSVGDVVRAFKARATAQIRRCNPEYRGRIWQRNYYDRVIRNEEEMNRIRQYIADNPGNWAEDRENPTVCM